MSTLSVSCKPKSLFSINVLKNLFKSKWEKWGENVWKASQLISFNINYSGHRFCLLARNAGLNKNAEFPETHCTDTTSKSEQPQLYNDIDVCAKVVSLKWNSGISGTSGSPWGLGFLSLRERDTCFKGSEGRKPALPLTGQSLIFTHLCEPEMEVPVSFLWFTMLIPSLGYSQLPALFTLASGLLNTAGNMKNLSGLYPIQSATVQ